MKRIWWFQRGLDKSLVGVSGLVMREFGFVGWAMGTNATVLGGKLAKSQSLKVEA